MTISTPIFDRAPRPRPRLGLTWLMTRMDRLLAAWTHVRQRGQLGGASSEARYDRYLAPHERVAIPRFH